jgi:Cu2+-exporting ATPase
MILTLLAFSGLALYVGWLDNTSPEDTPQPPDPEAPKEKTDALVSHQGPPEAAAQLRSAEQDPALRLDRTLATSLFGLGLAGIGALYSPLLSLISVPITLYSCFTLFQQAYLSIVKERRLRGLVIDSVAVIGALLAGYYFFTALMNTLFLISRKLLIRTENHARQKLVNILAEQPQFVWILRDEVEIQIPFGQLQPGDILVIDAGQIIPVDGVISRGMGSIDQHMITGESKPVDKGTGEEVLAATLLISGRIWIDVKHAGYSILASQIGQILDRTADYCDDIEARGDRFADQSVYPFLGLGALCLIGIGPTAAISALNSKNTVGVRFAIPLSMINILKQASHQGILIKDGRVLEILNEVDTVIFDKTGTLTQDQLRLEQIITCNGISTEKLLIYAASAESKQSHPIARAILQAATERSLRPLELKHASYQIGYGIRAEIENHIILVGSARLMAAENIAIPATIQDLLAQTEQQGSSLVYVSMDSQLAGIIELRPIIVPDAARVIAALRELNLSIYIVSGDHEAPTKRLASELGIDHYFSEVLPLDKAALVEKLQQQGRKVCFVGDGINDAVALKKANASVSFRGATTIATDTAQTVLMDGSISRLPDLFALARQFAVNSRAIIAASVIPSGICIAGILFMGFNVAAVILFGNLSLLASTGIAMLPALNTTKEPQDQPRR